MNHFYSATAFSSYYMYPRQFGLDDFVNIFFCFRVRNMLFDKFFQLYEIVTTIGNGS